jgi:integrase
VTTFHDFAAVVLDEREQAGIRGIDSEQNQFKLHIATAGFASMELTEIRAKHIREWLRVMAQKDANDTRGVRKICDQTIKRSFALVSSIATAAHEREEIEVNFCTGVKVKKRADERATKDKWTFLTIEEQIAIAKCDAIPYMDRLAIRFAIATGLRQGEQCNLLLADLHTGHDEPRVVVRHGSFKPKRGGMLPPKSGKIRTVPLFADGIVCAREWLYELPTFAPENPFAIVFPSERGTRRGVGKPLGRGPLLREYLKHVGITRRVRWHDLRHTFCTNLVTGALGHVWPLIAVKEMAGHSSITITERYAHVGQRDLVSLGAACTFSLGSVTPIARELPPAADDFYAFDWNEAASA